MFKKLFYVFVVSFIANLIWENLHAGLYFHPDGSSMTQWLLIKSAIIDAIFITITILVFLKIKYLRNKPILLVVVGVVAAICLEWYALQTGRWAYTDVMPIIPLLGVGLTPTIQLGTISYFVYKWLAIK